MIVDRREQILTRLKEVLQGIDHPAALNVYRGRGSLPADMRPCICLLSGGERPILDGQEKRRARASSSVMRMNPQILVQLKVRSLDEREQTDLELSELRMVIMPAIRNDADLIALTGENGDIAYKGHATDMEVGSPMEGQMVLFHDFDYVLDPDNLIP